MPDQLAPVVDLRWRRLRRDLAHLGVDCDSLLDRCTTFELGELADAAVREIAGMGGPPVAAVIESIAGRRNRRGGRRVA